MVDWGRGAQRRPEWLGPQGVRGLKGPGKSFGGAGGGVWRRSADFILAAVGKH